MSQMQRRVVITGVGIVSPLGNTKEALWNALIGGQSGVRPLDECLAGQLPVAFAARASEFRGEIDNFGPLDKDPKKAIRKALKVMCRESQMGVASAQLALTDARFVAGQVDPERVGVSFGTDYMLSEPEDMAEGIRRCTDTEGQFDFSRWGTDGMPRMSPLWLLKYLPNMPASHLAIFNDFRGPSNSITLREAAGNAALAEAREIILRGAADVMLAGATGTRIHPMKLIHALQQEELAAADGDPARASRPFDRRRTGMVLGEGAGTVLLEELSTAEARGATIYGELVGGASGAAAGLGSVAHRGRAMGNVLRAALRQTGAGPADVGHLHAHGLSTRSADVEEARAIHEVFGPRAGDLPVVAAKGHFGNLGAGSGVVEFVASLLALQHDRLFPVLNYDEADPECPVGVVAECRQGAGDSFLNLSVTPQGQASAVMVRRMG